jgi:predicted transcriptional regulator
MREEFIACGLTATEYEVLMHLLVRGVKSAGMIARGLDIKRSTVYSALQGLESRKLVARQKNGKTAEYISAPAEEIPALLVNQAKSSFEKIISSVRLIEPRIQKFQKGNAFNAGAIDINHIDNHHDYYALLEKYIITKDYCAVWNPQVVLDPDSVKEFGIEFLKKSARNRNKIKDIMIDGPMTRWYISKINNPNHQWRIVPDGDCGLADLVVVDDVVILSLNSPDASCALA